METKRKNMQQSTTTAVQPRLHKPRILLQSHWIIITVLILKEVPYKTLKWFIKRPRQASQRALYQSFRHQSCHLAILLWIHNMLSSQMLTYSFQLLTNQTESYLALMNTNQVCSSWGHYAKKQIMLEQYRAPHETTWLKGYDKVKLLNYANHGQRHRAIQTSHNHILNRTTLLPLIWVLGSSNIFDHDFHELVIE